MHTPVTTADRRTQMDRTLVTPEPGPGECGLVEHARAVALTVCHVLNGERWTAEAVSPAWPSVTADQHTRITVTVDNRWTIVVTKTRPAHSERELHTVTVNGQPIALRARRGEGPHEATAVARSIWRHLNNLPDDCDSFLCRQPATVASGTGSTCPAHSAAPALASDLLDIGRDD